MSKPNIVLCKPKSAACKLFLRHMQTHKSQQFRNVLQNPVELGPIFTCLSRAAHFWVNQAKSLFGGQKSLLSLSQFSRVCPPMYASVPVSNNDSLGVNSFDFALISLAVIIFVDAGIANSTGACSFLNLLFRIVVSIDENIFDAHIPPVCVHTKNKGRILWENRTEKMSISFRQSNKTHRLRLQIARTADISSATLRIRSPAVSMSRDTTHTKLNSSE